MQQTGIEKIINAHARSRRSRGTVFSGDQIRVRPRHVLSSDSTAKVIGAFVESAGHEGRIRYPEQAVVACTGTGELSDAIESFALSHGACFVQGDSRGPGTVLGEEGYAVPGALCLGTDPQVLACGAMSSVGILVKPDDAASVWASGESACHVPELIRVELVGSPGNAPCGEHLGESLAERMPVTGRGIEFVGAGVSTFSIESRINTALALAHQGAAAVLFQMDIILRDWMLEQADLFTARAGEDPHARLPYIRNDVERMWQDREQFHADPDARFTETVSLDLSSDEWSACASKG